MKYSVVAIGEPVIDFVETMNSSPERRIYQTNAGGGAANVLACAAALGGSPAMIGRVGNDIFGDYLVDTLIKYGVDPIGIKKDNFKQTGIGFVYNDIDGERKFTFYRGTQDVILYNHQQDFVVLENCQVFHFTSVSMFTEVLLKDTMSARNDARNLKKTISFDVNYRETLWKNKNNSREIIWEALNCVDIVKLSEEEIEFLLPGTSVNSCAKRLLDNGAKLVCISLGAKGCYLSTAKHSSYCLAPKVNVIDTTGCGDAFMGALLQTLCNNNYIDSIESLTPKSLYQIAQIAVFTASLCATRQGSFECMPTKSEVQYRIECDAEVRS